MNKDSQKKEDSKKDVKKKPEWSELAVYLLVLVLILSTTCMIYLSNLRAVAFDRELYLAEFDKYNIWDRFGEEDDLEDEVELLHAYLEKGEREQDIMRSDFYNDREKTHLVEVRDLFSSFLFLLDIAVWVSIFALVLMLVAAQRHAAKLPDREVAHFVKQTAAFLLVGIGFIVDGLAVMMGLMAAFFSVVFYYFHILFFKTDTWMLNPATDNLIRMFPQMFFFDLFVRIILLSVVPATVMLVVGIVLMKYKKKR